MRGKPLLIIFLVVFFDLLCFGIIIPIMPYYSREFGASAIELGWLMAIYSIAQFIFSPFWGSLSDTYGRRPILLLTISGGILATLATAFAPSLVILFCARLLAGFFGANISTATAYISDITKPEDRAKGMGIIGAGFGLGFIFGPALGGLLSPYGYSVPLTLAAGIGLFNLVFAYFSLGEPKLSTQVRQGNRRHLSLDFIQMTFASPKTTLPVLAFFFSTLAFTQLEVSFGLYVLHMFHYTAREAGMLLAGMGIIMVLIQGGQIGRLSKRFGEHRLVIFGSALMAVAMLGAASATSALPFIVCLVFIAIANSLTNPSLNAIMSKVCSESNRGGMLGVFQSASSLARIFGPIVAGLCFEHVSKSSPIFLASILMLIALTLSVFMSREA